MFVWLAALLATGLRWRQGRFLGTHRLHIFPLWPKARRAGLGSTGLARHDSCTGRLGGGGIQVRRVNCLATVMAGRLRLVFMCCFGSIITPGILQLLC